MPDEFKPIEGQGDTAPDGGAKGPDGSTLLTEGEQGGKPAEAKPGEEKPKEPVIPEAYEITAPEGMEVDRALLESFTPLAKELKLDNEGVQKLSNFFAEQQKGAMAAQQKAWTDVVDGWVKATNTDPEIGGEKLGPALAKAKAVVDKYGNDKLKAELFDQYGIGNHPEVIRFLAKVGADMADDRLHEGHAGASGTKSLAEVMYPSSQK